MSWVLELAANIPAFLTYVVPGYLFLAVYRYMLFKDEDSADKTSSLLLNSIIISFVLKTLYDAVISALPMNRNGNLYLILIILLGIVTGFIAAKFVVSNAAVWVFDKLGITRTVNSNIWDDVIEQGQWLRIWLPDSGRSYYGQIAAMENYSREPIVWLRNYQFLDDDGTPLIDNVADCDRTVLLNLSGFERVEIVVPKEGSNK